MGFQTPGLPRGSVARPLAAPGAARSGLRAPRWPACFARPGITRRLPFASGAAVKVPPPSLARSPGRPERASSPAPRSLANLPDPSAAERQRGHPRAPGRLLALRYLRASAAPAAAWRAGCGRPACLPRPASRALSRRTAGRGRATGVATLPSTGQCGEQHTRDRPNCLGSPGTETQPSRGFSLPRHLSKPSVGLPPTQSLYFTILGVLE